MTTGTRVWVLWPATRLRVVTTWRVTTERRRLCAGVAARDAEAGVEAGRAPGERAAPAFGIATCGKTATGTVNPGSTTGATVGDRSARIPATKVTTYGRASATSPATPNQKRCRRVPSPPSPKGRVPPDPAPAYAGFSRCDKCRPPAAKRPPFDPRSPRPFVDFFDGLFPRPHGYELKRRGRYA